MELLFFTILERPLRNHYKAHIQHFITVSPTLSHCLIQIIFMKKKNYLREKKIFFFMKRNIFFHENNSLSLNFCMKIHTGISLNL